MISFVAQRGMNAYLYAPKDDAKHRRRWREPYDDAESSDFVDLSRHCEALGVRFGFAISPGLDIDYASPADRDALLAKLRPLVDAGVRWFVLALDDIPLAAGLAARQAALTTWLHDELRALRADTTLAICPTEYSGTRPSPYLAELGAATPLDVDVMWTGPTVCSPAITAPQADMWAAALGGRPPLIWDNFPVNDGPMAPALHLGPYRGRDPDLAGATVGVLCNPMPQAIASQIGLATAAEFLSDPYGYDTSSAWERAIGDVGGPHAAPLRALARACASSPVNPPSEMPIARLVSAVEAATDPGTRATALDELASDLSTARSLTTSMSATAMSSDAGTSADDAVSRTCSHAERAGEERDSSRRAAAELAEEVAPWAEAAEREARVGLCAVDLLRRVAEAVGSAPVAVAEPLLRSAFLLIVLWGDARSRSDRIVYGPRFSIHPAVVPLIHGASALDVGLAVTEDASSIDRLCRCALAAYQRWSAEVPA